MYFLSDSTDSCNNKKCAILYINIDNNKIFAYTANKKINSSLPTIIFIHGAANDHSVWGLQSRYFSYHGWNTVAVDLLGHGKSSGGSLKSIESYSKHLSKLIKQLDLKNITVKIFCGLHALHAICNK